MKLFEKFKVIARWMHNDSREAMVKAQAHFLVAMGMFNYIETLGAFLTGYYEKETNGQNKKDKNGKDLRTKNTQRFKAFFSYMGKEYTNLINSHLEMYEELRCGFVHEFLPSGRWFCITWYDGSLTDEISEDFNSCGVILANNNGKEGWIVALPKLLIDFRKAKDKLIAEIANEQDKKLFEFFFETANKINFDSFPI